LAFKKAPVTLEASSPEFSLLPSLARDKTGTPFKILGHQPVVFQQLGQTLDIKEFL
jgi:hypothetical protein